jgi:hypothetical protein
MIHSHMSDPTTIYPLSRLFPSNANPKLTSAANLTFSTHTTLIYTKKLFIFPASTGGFILSKGLYFCGFTGVLLCPGRVFVPGYGFTSVLSAPASDFVAPAALNGFGGPPGRTAVFFAGVLLWLGKEEPG